MTPKINAAIPWRLVPYVDASGESQVLDFLEQLKKTDFKAYTFFNESLRKLFEERGPLTGEPYWREEGDAFRAIAFKGRRIYCSVESGRRIMMYHAVSKNWAKFRREDRNLCEKRRDDMLGANYDEQQRSFLYLNRQKQRTHTHTNNVTP